MKIKWKKGKIRIFSLVLISLGVFLSLNITSPVYSELSDIFKPKEMEIKKLPSVPLIDGKIDEACWKQATRVSGFTAISTLAPATEATTAYLGFDEGNLYVAFKCQESRMGKIKATDYGRDGRLWQNDSVEIFLDTNQDRETYFHFIIDVSGNIYDAIGQDKKFNFPVKAKTFKGKDFWSAEVLIPFDSLAKYSELKDTWGINLGREEKAKGEFSSWVFVGTSFHNPGRFGEAKFVGADFDQYQATTPKVVKKEGVAVRQEPLKREPPGINGGITLNKDLFPVHEGKAFFPIGIFAMSRETKKWLPELAESGFNIVQHYNLVYWDLAGGKDAKLIKPFLDEAHRLGLLVLFSLRGDKELPKGREHMEKIVRQILAKYKDNPAIFGWYTFDEPYPEISPAQVLDIDNLVKSIDPYHPTVVAFAYSTRISRYLDSSDILAPDIYPFPLKAPLSKVSSFTKDAVERAAGKKPIWIILQVFDARRVAVAEGRPFPPIDIRAYPNYQEMRNMTFQAIVNGAKGIFYFALEYDRGFLRSEERWGALKKVASELRDLSPVLMSPSLGRVNMEPDNLPIETLVKKYQGNVYLFAVNKEDKKLKVRFNLSKVLRGAGRLSAEVLFENRKVSIGNRGLVDEFAGFDVHIYKIKEVN